MTTQFSILRVRASRGQWFDRLKAHPQGAKLWNAANEWGAKVSRSVAGDFMEWVLTREPGKWSEFPRGLLRRRTGRYGQGEVRKAAEDLDKALSCIELSSLDAVLNDPVPAMPSEQEPEAGIRAATVEALRELIDHALREADLGRREERR